MPPVPQGVKSGRLTLTNSNATPLSPTSIPCTAVGLRKLSGGAVYVGDTNVATTGWELIGREVYAAKDVKDIIVKGTNGDVILWVATKAANY